jgi:2-hydroxy-4-(methylsulfanyl)butanoate S-methyltransferase
MLANRTTAEERRHLTDIAYGFMASKALFAVLELDLFTELADGPRTCAELSARTGMAPNRLQTLLHALTGLGLTVLDRGAYGNAPATLRWLVRGAPDAYGDYFRLQGARQIYRALLDLDAGMAGTGGSFATLAGLLADADEARTFTAAQHVASLGPARALAPRLPIRDARSLLDVGGGSGAFTIALCDRNPALRSTLLELPAVVDLARDYCAEAGLGARVDFLTGDAVACVWPVDQDVVLMSYLLSGLGDHEVDVVLTRAMDSLSPGGLLVLHDVMLDDDWHGPAIAALWFLQDIAYRSDSVAFSAADLRARLRRHGFLPTTTEALIPGLTKVVLARKGARP